MVSVACAGGGGGGGDDGLGVVGVEQPIDETKAMSTSVRRIRLPGNDGGHCRYRFRRM
jgi:hypothetical protein